MMVEVIDFDDMVWLPVVHGLKSTSCDVLYVDEAQDLNPTQHGLVGLLAGGGRTVVIGDDRQAIYAWRGADPESMGRLAALLEGAPGGLKRLPLTVTFRCPRRHVLLAREYVPDFEAAPWATEGEVGACRMEELTASSRPQDLVIGRTNGAVIRAALAGITALKPAVVKGRQVGEQLLAILRQIGDGARTTADLVRRVEDWRGKELRRLEQVDGAEDLIDSVGDRADGLQAVLSACASPGDVEPTVGGLFAEEARADAVTFSTIHRAKGLEAGVVWRLLDHARAPADGWARQQEDNLAYVALTRARKSLISVECQR